MHPNGAGFDLLTLTDVAKLLHCSKAHVCNAVAGPRTWMPNPSTPDAYQAQRDYIKRLEDAKKSS